MQTSDEILAAEKAVDDRKRSRAKGFKKMQERDRGWTILRPHHQTVREVVMEWGESDTLFKLTAKPYGGQKPVEIILDAEEVRKWLRWV